MYKLPRELRGKTTYIQRNSKLDIQILRGDRAYHKDSELHRNPCAQTSSLTIYGPCVLGYFLRDVGVAFEC